MAQQEAVRPAIPSLAVVASAESAGLSSSEAAALLAKDGLNAMPILRLICLEMLSKFWAPVPWPLQASMVLHGHSNQVLQTAELVRTAFFVSSQQKIVRNLAFLQWRGDPADSIYTPTRSTPWSEIVPPF